MNDVTPLDKVYPWRRYFARLIDMLVLGVCIYFIVFILIVVSILLFFPTDHIHNQFYNLFEKPSISLSYFVSITTYVPYLFIEALLIKYFATTPGKALMGIKIFTKDFQKLSYKDALARSFRVFTYGLGLMIPFVYFIACLYAYKSLKRNKVSYWDKDKNIHYCHYPISKIRELIGGLIALGLLLLNCMWNHNWWNHH